MIAKQRTLFWQIFTVTLVIILGTIASVAWFGSRSIDDFYIEELRSDLENRAYLIKSQVGELLTSGDLDGLRSFVVKSGRAADTRITVVDADGTVLADTKENPAAMDNHRQRPEIDAAFSGVSGFSLRFSNTLGQRMLYGAIGLEEYLERGVGIGDRGSVNTVLRVAVPVIAIDEALGDINRELVIGTGGALLIAFVVTFFVVRNISRPLEEMTRGAELYANGNFSQRMLINHKKTTSREVAMLATAMDRMAGQLDEKINTIINQRNQLETVISSMVEAVIAVDCEERIISINGAAARMFSVPRQGAPGRLGQEVIRNVDLHDQLARILKTGEAFEDEIVLARRDDSVYLHTNVVMLYGGDGRTVGALMVLNDVTRLRKLERLRSDFVANVSHELKTPITSIRGYVETLLDGALDDREHARRFLEIVLRQSEQLGTIIDDLLTLSRIEKDTKEAGVSFVAEELSPVLHRALETCRQQAAGKQVNLTLDCPEQLVVRMNRTLLEQAVVNLLTNGITYSDPGDSVQVRVAAVDDPPRRLVKISVVDQGIGIAKEHLPRLFERFYRSDRARNRKAGGTGLGLAIVKHIVQAHGGSVEVDSAIGAGSTFTITLPMG
ncbi:MAG: ATP-binding protein [Desulfofustis sp.]|jgi:two-component system phosphate regulon sensor histidine kinase PhoR|nr:ATP-binding protein [Desulfofustis sp.]